MKKLILFLMFGSLVMSCNESEDTLQPGTVDDLSASAQNFLRLQSGSQSAQATGSAATLTNSAKSMASVLGSASVNGANSFITKDSSAEWDDCSTRTEVENSDGSTTLTIDYGDGCSYNSDGNSYIQFGKSITTYRFTSSQKGGTFVNSFSNNSVYKNFGGKFISSDFSSEWRVNGRNFSEGEFTYDTITSLYKGWFNSIDSSSYAFNGESYVYDGTQKTKYEGNKVIVESQTFRYSKNDDFYESQVLEPVVTDYSCQPTAAKGDAISILPVFSTPVSGRIRVSYRQDGKAGSFEINYGDGTCDGRFTIIENGKIIEVDQNDVSTMLAEPGS